MRLPTERQAFAFLEPLRGKSVIITVKSRNTNASASHFVLGCLALSRTYAVIFDTSAFIGTNVRSLAGQLPKAFLQRSNVIVPESGYSPEVSLSEVVLGDTSAFLIDDLNALLYLMSPRGDRSGIHRLSAFFHLLAYSARVNKSFTIGTVYKGESNTTSPRSLMSVSELQMTADVRDGELSFECPGIGWPDGRFTVPYLDPST